MHVRLATATFFRLLLPDQCVKHAAAVLIADNVDEQLLYIKSDSTIVELEYCTCKFNFKKKV